MLQDLLGDRSRRRLIGWYADLVKVCIFELACECCVAFQVPLQASALFSGVAGVETGLNHLWAGFKPY